jgi:hypothetical protein
VVHLEVLRLQRNPVGAEAVVGGYQDVDQTRVLEPAAHLATDELGDRLADLLDKHLAEAGQPQLQRPVLVDLLQDLLPPGRRAVRPGMLEVVFEAGEGVRDGVAELREAGLVPVLVGLRVLRILHRQHVLRGPGEHGQLLDLGCDRLDHLNPGGPDPDHPDPLAGQLDRLLRPA